MKREGCEKILKKTIDKLVSSNVNSACWFCFQQPKMPKGAEKFRKK